MFYKALGFAVWKLATRYLRERYGRFVKPVATATLVATAIALYVATRGDE
jgi:hypothetical protein